MSVPRGVWGLVELGEFKGAKVIVEAAPDGGWDIYVYPPGSDGDEWNYWADNDRELEAFFASVAPLEDYPAWVWPCQFPGVRWNVSEP